MENRKKSIEELQAELSLESEALATLQIIYADKVKQVRTNTSLPADIQARFLTEWENFYQQRVSSIFRKEYRRLSSHTEDDLLTAQIKHSSPLASAQTLSSEPITPAAAPAMPPAPVMPPIPPTPAPAVVAPPPVNPPAVPKPPIVPPVPQMAPVIKKNFEPPPPPPPPSLPMQKLEPQPINDDILGVNTESWMNVAESISYEQYENEPISANLMDSDKPEVADNDYDSEYMDENESIDGFAATSGLKGLTEFMDFDLKRKKS